MPAAVMTLMGHVELRRLVLGFVLIAAAIVALPVRALAQPPMPARPFRSLFNARPQEPGHEQSLLFTLSAYGGYDDNVVGGQAGGAGVDPRAQVGGGVIGTDANLAYTKNVEHTQFVANLGGSYRRYPSESSLSAASYTAGAGVSHQLAHRTRVQASGNVGFQPTYQLGLFPTLPDQSLGAVLPSNLDYAVLRSSSVIVNTTESLDQQLSRRSSITFSYDFTQQTFGNSTPATGATDLQAQGCAIRFRRQVSRYMSLRLGYGYRHAVYNYPAHSVVDGHNIDVGVDYARSLAFSRHTTFSFSTGSTIVDFQGNRFANVTGNATLSHLFTRNWNGSVAYNRDLSFVASISQPMFADSATARLQGIIAQRVMVTFSGGYLSGSLGLSQETTSVHTGTGAVSLVYALTDYLGLTADYSYYTYDFSNAVALPVGLKPNFDRNSVRGGLTLWLPLIR
jgi:hypothetical protein